MLKIRKEQKVTLESKFFFIKFRLLIHIKAKYTQSLIYAQCGSTSRTNSHPYSEQCQCSTYENTPYRIYSTQEYKIITDT